MGKGINVPKIQFWLRKERMMFNVASLHKSTLQTPTLDRNSSMIGRPCSKKWVPKEKTKLAQSSPPPENCTPMAIQLEPATDIQIACSGRFDILREETERQPAVPVLSEHDCDMNTLVEAVAMVVGSGVSAGLPIAPSLVNSSAPEENCPVTKDIPLSASEVVMTAAFVLGNEEKTTDA